METRDLEHKKELYYRLIDLTEETEQSRWNWFNGFLFADGLFLGGWLMLALGESTSDNVLIQLLLSFIGTGISLVWYFMARKTNKYLEEYYARANRIGEEIFDDVKIYQGVIEKKKTRLPGPKTLTQSVPLIFSIVFAVLLFISLLPKSF
jgi:hypothetical protein